jgi:hypothetical protein
MDRIGPVKTHLVKVLSYATSVNALRKELCNVRSELTKKDTEL